MKNSKKELLSTIQYLNDDQAAFVNDFIKTLSTTIVGKQEMLKLAFSEIETNKIDSAIPLDYQRRIEEVLPTFKSHFNCYNYNTNLYGEMTNIPESIILKAINLFK